MARRTIDVDERGRTSLAQVRTRPYGRYLVEEKPDGTLILTPAVTVPAALVPPDVLAKDVRIQDT